MVVYISLGVGLGFEIDGLELLDEFILDIKGMSVVREEVRKNKF